MSTWVGLPWLRTLRRCRTELLCEKDSTNCWFLAMSNELIWLISAEWLICWYLLIFVDICCKCCSRAGEQISCAPTGQVIHDDSRKSITDLPAAFAQKTSSLGLCKHNTHSWTNTTATYHVTDFARVCLGFFWETKSVSLVHLARVPLSSARLSNYPTE